MGRNIKDIKRELIHLEHKYQTLAIKTVDYVEIKAKLEEELEKEIRDINKGTAKELKGYKPSKRPSFSSKISDRNEKSKYPTSINSDDEYRSAIPSDIRY